MPCLAIKCKHVAPFSAAAYNDAMARKEVLKVITLFGSPNTDPREKIYTIVSALSRGHPIALGIRYGVDMMPIRSCEVLLWQSLLQIGVFANSRLTCHVLLGTIIAHVPNCPAAFSCPVSKSWMPTIPTWTFQQRGS
jgi:hypothetical protein